MKRRILGALLHVPFALLAGALVTACFVQQRPVEEIFDVAFLTEEQCSSEGASSCHDGDPCTRDSCEPGWQLCLYQPDDSLVPDDGQDCTVDSCADGAARHEPAAAGTPCGLDGALQCDGNGACVGCGGDASSCGLPSSCLSWTCQGDACAPDPAPAGQPLPLVEQIDGDCGQLQCDGKGGFDSVRWDDPSPSPWEVCRELGCFNGVSLLQAAGTPCGGACGAWDTGRGTVIQFACTAEGTCDDAETTPCGLGYNCIEGGCRTSCTPETVLSDCVLNASCVGGKCVMAPGPLADCQTSCAAYAALGCPVDWSSPSCEDVCLAVTSDAQTAGCYEAGETYLACLGATAKTVTTCAEHRTACAAEYELFLECQGTDVPDGPECSLLPCTTSFDGCTCAGFCGGAMLADHCLAGPDGTFTCTCAKDGATVATCEGAAGCGIENGCCQGM
jgi:hypothetical protein